LQAPFSAVLRGMSLGAGEPAGARITADAALKGFRTQDEVDSVVLKEVQATLDSPDRYDFIPQG